MPVVQSVIEIAIEAKTSPEKGRLREAVDRAVKNDPLVVAIHDEESGQTLLRAPDERHLNLLVTTLACEIGKTFTIGAPQVAYRETLASAADADYAHKRQLGPAYQFGRVIIRVEPNHRGQGIRIVNATKANHIPTEYIPAIEQGILDVAADGSLMGFPIIDFTATLIGGAYHDIDSSAVAFQLAAQGAMRQAIQKAGIELLEPIMKIAVVTHTRWLVHIENELTRLGATIDVTPARETGVVIATAAMATLFGIENNLTALTKGEAAVAMICDHYAPVSSSWINPDDTFPAAAAIRA